MIKSKNGEVTLNGSNLELEMDLAAIVNAFVDCNKKYGVDFAKKRVMKAVEMGFKSEEEIEKELSEKLKSDIRESFKDGELTKGLAELIAILGGIR